MGSGFYAFKVCNVRILKGVSSIATKLTINAASAGASVPSTGEIISPTFWIGSSSVAAGMLFAIVLIQKKRKSVQR